MSKASHNKNDTEKKDSNYYFWYWNFLPLLILASIFFRDFKATWDELE